MRQLKDRIDEDSRGLVGSNGNIYAAHNGVAYIYNKCKFRNNDYNRYNVETCGAGYGNYVKVLSPEGYMAIYAHLSRVMVSNGSYVRAGTKILLWLIISNI